jgi:hypothetical protein
MYKELILRGEECSALCGCLRLDLPPRGLEYMNAWDCVREEGGYREGRAGGVASMTAQGSARD